MSARRQAEAGLALYRQIVAHSREAVAIIDPLGQYVEQNAAHHQLIGYSDEELRGATPAIHFGEQAFAAISGELGRSGHYHGELVSRTKDGRELTIELLAFAVYDDAGRPTHYVGIKHDVTERKRAEQQRQEMLTREQEARARAEAALHALKGRVRQQEVVASLGQRALAGDNLAVLMQDATDMVSKALEVEYAKVLELLPGAKKLRLRAGIGWQSGAVGRAVVGAGTDSQAGYTLACREPVIVADLRTETRFSGPPLLHRHGVVSGLSVIIQGRASPFGVLGAHTTRRRTFTQEDVHFVQSVANVLALAVERQRAADGLREEAQIVETLHRTGSALVQELDLQKVVQAVTDAATRVSGAAFGAFFYNVIDQRGEAYTLYTLSGAPMEAFAGFPMPRNTPVFGPTFRGEGVVRLDDVTRDPRYGKNHPYQGMPEGHLPVRSYLAVPVLSRGGEVLGGLFLGHPRVAVFDERAERLAVGIASQAAIALDNARLYQQARRAIQARDVFLANVSHNLRTPLTVIHGQAQLLERQVARLEASVVQHLAARIGAIDASTRRMAALIDELLDVVQLEMGKALVLDYQRTDLLAVVRELVAMQQETSGQRLRLETNLPSLLGIGDVRRLQQVVENLLSNALKYSSEGTPVVVRVQRDDGWAVLQVEDQGVGIPTPDVPHLFERFHRGRNVEGRVPGTGLGLWGVRQVVEQHRGTINIESTEGQGTTVTVRLPLQHEPGAESARSGERL